MSCSAPADAAGASDRPVGRARALGDAGTVLAVAAPIALLGRASGAFEVTVWAPLGVALTAALALAIAAGFRPRRAIGWAGACILCLGCWSVASTAWGGLPDSAWKTFDQALVAATALLLGSAIGGGRRQLVLAGALAGLAAEAAEVLARLAVDPSTGGWVVGRFVDGPVGYHNAQGVTFALGVPLALWAMGSPRAARRAAGGAAGSALVAALLLTQSRGAVGALALALVVQVALARRSDLAVRLALLVAVGVGLTVALRRVDATLLSGDASTGAASLRAYAGFAALAATLLAATGALGLTIGRLRRPLTVAFAALAVAGAGVAASTPSPGSGLAAALATIRSDAQPVTAAGDTRFGDLSLNGRRDAWRVAAGMFASSPVLGDGQGQFARRWTIDRRLTRLYIVQPHSVELELAGELGLVGLALFLAFVALALRTLVRTGDRGSGSAALAVLLVLLIESSFDWTWSFPALVATALLVVGAAAGGASRPLEAGRPRSWLATAAVALAAIGSLVVPLLAHEELTQARAASASQATEATSWRYAERARRLAPWSADVLDFEGRLAESAGRFRLAAARYGMAASTSARPWLESFREAQALSLAGEVAASRAACERARAANPGEPLLAEGPCATAAG